MAFSLRWLAPADEEYRRLQTAAKKAAGNRRQKPVNRKKSRPEGGLSKIEPEALADREKLSRNGGFSESASASGSSRGRFLTGQPEGLFLQVQKCIQLLCNDPRHPGLRTHEFHSIEHPFDSRSKVFVAYVQNRTASACRVFWCYGPAAGEITVIAITAHP